MPETVQYDAFISYRHLELDKKVAVKLQKLLEGYVPPKAVRKAGAFRRFRVFRDETELTTSNSLTEAIQQALRNTRYLIVVCSAGTAQSRWCIEEIEYFKALHGGSTGHIRVITIEGDPGAVIPPQLLSEERQVADEDGAPRTETVPVEPLALNITAGTARKTLRQLKIAYIRIAATLLDHNFEDLYQRNQRRFFRRALALGTAVAALLVGIIVYGASLLVYANGQRALAQDNLVLARQQQRQAEQNLERARSLVASMALDHAAALAGSGARTRAAALAYTLYGAFDPAWDNHAQLLTGFRDTALAAMY